MRRLILIASSFALGIEIILWEVWLAPLHAGAWTLALLAIPMFAVCYAAWRNSNYGLQVASMLILAYLAEGVMRVLNDRGTSALLAGVEVVLAAVFFVTDLAYLGPLKRDKRKAANS
jgi:uncharacterized membrane protein